jgi:glutamate dehydrogenase (NAD(P)+)
LARIIVGLCEFEGAIYNEDGLDVEAVFQHRKATGSILGYAGAKKSLKTLWKALSSHVIF